MQGGAHYAIPESALGTVGRMNTDQGQIDVGVRCTLERANDELDVGQVNDLVDLHVDPEAWRKASILGAVFEGPNGVPDVGEVGGPLRWQPQPGHIGHGAAGHIPPALGIPFGTVGGVDE